MINDVKFIMSQGAESYVRKPVDFLQLGKAMQQLGLYSPLLNEAPPKEQKTL